MLFRDKLKEISKPLETEFEKLFALALENQTHDGDLLLVCVNGSVIPNLNSFVDSEGINYGNYVTGPNTSGLADSTHYNFIHQYRSNIYPMKLVEYQKLHIWSKERQQEIDDLRKAEELSIHLETLVYLKIWEGDYFSKIWYHFVQCILGKPYNWHYKIKSSNRSEGIAVRQELIRIHIRDAIKPFSEPVYNAFKIAYNTQIRNSIAHSNFSFLGRNIHPNNFIENDRSHQLHSLKFDEWIDMFHSTIVLHNFYIKLKNKISEYYGQIYLNSQIPQEIRIIKDDGGTIYSYLKYRPEYQDWTSTERPK